MNRQNPPTFWQVLQTVGNVRVANSIYENFWKILWGVILLIGFVLLKFNEWLGELAIFQWFNRFLVEHGLIEVQPLGFSLFIISVLILLILTVHALRIIFNKDLSLMDKLSSLAGSQAYKKGK